MQTQVTGLDVANINKTVLSYLDSATLRRGDAAGIIEVVEESELDVNQTSDYYTFMIYYSPPSPGL